MAILSNFDSARYVGSSYCYRRFVGMHFFLHYHIRSSMLPVFTTCQAKSLMRFWFVILKFKRKTLLSATATGRKGPTLACMLLLAPAAVGMYAAVSYHMCVRCCFFFWQPGKKQPGSTFFWLVACSAVFEKYYAGMMVLGLYMLYPMMPGMVSCYIVVSYSCPRKLILLPSAVLLVGDGIPGIDAIPVYRMPGCQQPAGRQG